MRAVWSGVLAATLLIAPATRAADVAAGKAKAQVCAGCHGENGVSQTENIPSLAGQPDQFLQWQLVFFRAGSRKNEQMQPIVEEITNEDIRNLGAYFSQLAPPKGAEDGDPDLSRKGAQVAAGRRCASCHTDSYAGTKAVARLAASKAINAQARILFQNTRLLCFSCYFHSSLLFHPGTDPLPEIRHERRWADRRG